MTLSPHLDEALLRLNAALHRVQAAVDERLEADVAGTDRAREFTLLQEDRARLAAELDAALARQAALLAAQAEVYHRLDRAGRTVEQVLQQAGGAGRLAAGGRTLMRQVVVTIAGRAYRMACGEGEEAHLRGVASRLDGKITELKGEFGEIGDQRVTVMAALTMADDLTEAERRIAVLETQVAVLAERENAGDDRVAALGAAVAAALDEVTAGLDGVSHAVLRSIR